MSPVLVLALVGGALLLLGGKRRVPVIVAYPVDVNTTPLPTSQPQPPTSGDGFRQGAQPDPSAPNDPNRGRFFAVWGQSKYDGSVAKHEAALLSLPMDANGTVEVVIWAERDGKPERCSSWGSTVAIANGRAVLPGGWSLERLCGDHGVTWTDPGGCIVNNPKLAWQNRGGNLVLLWETSVRDATDDSDEACDEHLGFLVDIFWRYVPGPRPSGVSR